MLSNHGYLGKSPIAGYICVPGLLLELCLVEHLAASIYVGLQGMSPLVHSVVADAYQQTWNWKSTTLVSHTCFCSLDLYVIARSVEQYPLLVFLLQSLLLFLSQLLASLPGMKKFLSWSQSFSDVYWMATDLDGKSLIHFLNPISIGLCLSNFRFGV